MLSTQAYSIFTNNNIKITWLINGVTKSLSFSVFLFFNFTLNIFLFYSAIKPKDISKKLLVYGFIISYLDLLFYLLCSNRNVFFIKMLVFLLIVFILNKKLALWVKE